MKKEKNLNDEVVPEFNQKIFTNISYYNSKIDDIKFYFEKIFDEIWYNKIKAFFKFIPRLIQYIPIIWKDRDWDHYHLMALIEYKLKRMQKYFTNSRIIVDEEREQIIKEISYALSLLEKINNTHDIFNDEYEEIKRKWPNKKLIGFSCEEEKNDFLNHYRKVDNEEQRLISEFFSYVRKNYEKWWD